MRKAGETWGKKLQHLSKQHRDDFLLLALHDLLLRELVQNGERLVHLRVHRVGRLKKVEQLRVVHLEQHARDLARELRLRPEGWDGYVSLRCPVMHLWKCTYGAIFM